MSTSSLYIPVELTSPSDIEFVGYIPEFENAAFKLLDADGKDTGYVGEFAPNELRNTRVFPCLIPNDNQHLGLCKDERVVATLLCLAFPKGVTKPIPDFAAIRQAVDGLRRLSLLSEDDARQVCSYAPFNTKWLSSRLESTTEYQPSASLAQGADKRK